MPPGGRCCFYTIVSRSTRASAFARLSGDMATVVWFVAPGLVCGGLWMFTPPFFRFSATLASAPGSSGRLSTSASSVTVLKSASVRACRGAVVVVPS